MKDEPIAAHEPLMTEPPTYEGPRGRVWKIPLDRYTIQKSGALASWLVDAPGVHPIWRCWILAAYHLRPTDDAPDPELHAASMTHGLMSIALDPDFTPDPMTPDDFAGHGLRPIDWEVQFRVRTDELAREVIDGGVRAIVDGRMHPDTDFRKRWMESLQIVADRIQDMS